MELIPVHIYYYQCFIDGKPVFNKHAESWQEALNRAILWRNYITRPYKTIEILNVFTGVKLSLDECIRRAELFKQHKL